MMRFVFIFCWFGILVSCNEDRVQLPNVIIIFTDDQGYQDLASFGSPDITTPHLDQLAAEGILLTDFSVAQPVCTASRAALLTGCYPNRIGLWGALMPEEPRGLAQQEYTMAEMLKSVGYATGIFGKWHLGNMGIFSPLQHGFDEFYGIPYSNDMWPHHPWQGPIFNFDPLPLYDGDVVIDTIDDQSNLTRDITVKAVDFINRKRDEPFFLYVPHPQPHVPLFVSDAFKGKSKRGLYGDVISEIDWSVGEIVKALEKNQLTENTVVIFTSDNGPWLAYGTHSGSALPFREGKGTTWEGGVREPFIIKYPDKLKGGKVVNTPVMSIDLQPTLARLTGAKLSGNKIDGLDVWDVLNGTSDESPHDAFYYYYGRNELRGVRKGDWKLHFPHTYSSLGGREGGKDGLPEKYEYPVLEKMELYNLSTDKEESINVIDQYPEIVAELQKLADNIRKDLGDDLTNVTGNGQRKVGSNSVPEE